MGTIVNVREARPGVYMVEENGEFHVDVLDGLINTGSTDCTAKVYRHEGGHRDGPRGKEVAQFTLIRGKLSKAPQQWFPPAEPLIVDVGDFVMDMRSPIERAVEQDKEDELLRKAAVADAKNRENALAMQAYLTAGNSDGGSAQEHHYDIPPESYRPAVEQPAAPSLTMSMASAPSRMPGSTPIPASAATAYPSAALFPGFIVFCTACKSGNVSLTTGKAGKAYLECEACGAMCRVRVEE